MSNVYQLKKIIQEKGSISIADFMEQVIAHPEFGYYARCDAIGDTGDFITAPEISQLFGEIIGVWLAYYWNEKGRPNNIALVELGPGKGTLMNDILRSTKHVQGFHQSLSVHLIEISPRLRSIQKKALDHYHNVQFFWHNRFADVPSLPIFLVANEFFDALPIHQYIKYSNCWYENMVSITPGREELYFNKIPVAKDNRKFLEVDYQNVEEDLLVEVCPAGITIIKEIALRIKEQGGAALVIDYGYDTDSGKKLHYTSTLQAVKNHKYHPVLSDIGEADITAHVDFSALKKAALVKGVNVHEIISQREFLVSMGINVRARMLVSGSNSFTKEAILKGLDRLISPLQMGELFKVLAIT
jgi:NADH dehydrogenase [ubiquinone] 1 alpha subcomplex assembly factor 7